MNDEQLGRLVRDAFRRQGDAHPPPAGWQTRFLEPREARPGQQWVLGAAAVALAAAVIATMFASQRLATSGVPRPASSAAASPVPATSPSAPLSTWRPDRGTSTEPAVSRLSAPVAYWDLQIQLDPVDPALAPPISAAQAYARCGSCPHDKPVQDFEQRLVYFSARTPATIPVECVPRGQPMPSYCAGDVSVPHYQHRLAWVFTWYELVAFSGAVSEVSPRPRPTLVIGFHIHPFDASTGEDEDGVIYIRGEREPPTGR